MNAIGPGLLFLPVGQVLLVLLDIDGGYHVLPEPFNSSYFGLIVRYILIGWTMWEAQTTLGTIHLLLMTLLMHTNSIFNHLKTYQPRKRHRTANIIQSFVIKTKGNALVKGDKDPPQSRNVYGKSKIISVFDGYNSLQLYQIATYCFTAVRAHLDTSLFFVLFPGFFLDVVLNYVVITCFDELPLSIYCFAALAAILVRTIIVTELPRGARNYETCVTLLNYWKSNCPRRKDYMYKKINSCRPLGYSTGGLFVFKNKTTTTFYEALINNILTAVITFK